MSASSADNRRAWLPVGRTGWSLLPIEFLQVDRLSDLAAPAASLAGACSLVSAVIAHRAP